MSKPFKERVLGKVIWGIGDALKGKGKGAGVVDAIFEMAPIPNPVRIAKEKERNEALKTLAENQFIREMATDVGVELSDLVEDGPQWLKPAVVLTFVIGILILVGLGLIDGSFLGELIKTIFGI